MHVTGVLGSALLRRNRERALIEGNSQQQIVLIAGFVQGLNIVECAITEGCYVQAAALLRQELETVAALEELKAGIRRDKTTPNVGHVPWSLATLYGDLSAAAHAARHNFLQQILDPQDADLPENTTAVRLFQFFTLSSPGACMGSMWPFLSSSRSTCMTIMRQSMARVCLVPRQKQ